MTSVLIPVQHPGNDERSVRLRHRSRRHRQRIEHVLRNPRKARIIIAIRQLTVRQRNRIRIARITPEIQLVDARQKTRL